MALRNRKMDLLDAEKCVKGSAFWGKPDPTKCDIIDDKLAPLKRELAVVTAKF